MESYGAVRQQICYGYKKKSSSVEYAVLSEEKILRSEARLAFKDLVWLLDAQFYSLYLWYANFGLFATKNPPLLAAGSLI